MSEVGGGQRVDGLTGTLVITRKVGIVRPKCRLMRLTIHPETDSETTTIPTDEPYGRRSPVTTYSMNACRRLRTCGWLRFPSGQPTLLDANGNKTQPRHWGLPRRTVIVVAAKVRCASERTDLLPQLRQGQRFEQGDHCPLGIRLLV